MNAINRYVFAFVFWAVFTGCPLAGFAQTPDVDRDGFSDYMEQLFGTDPSDVQSHPTLSDNHLSISAYWPLLSDAKDYFSEKHDGTVKGGAAFSIDGLQLDGKSGYVDFGSSRDLGSDKGIAWSVWIKPDKQSGQISRILGKFSVDGNNREFACFLKAGAVYAFVSGDGTADRGSTVVVSSSKKTVAAGTWTHIAVSWKAGETLRLYINGAEVATDVLEFSELEDLAHGSASFTLGAYDIDSASKPKANKPAEKLKNPFDGGINGLVLFRHEISALEAAELFALGRGGDLPGYINTDFDGDGMQDWWERLYFGDTRRDSLDDFDADGMPDVWEVRYFGNAGQAADGDYDGDWLSNLDEYRQGTDPTLKDTDSDKIGDWMELACAAALSKNYSPALKDTFRELPLFEDFEHGTMQGWSVNNGIATNIQLVSGGGYEMYIDTNSCVQYDLIGATGNSVVWEHYNLKYGSLAPCSDPPRSLNPVRAVSFYIHHGL